jgi:hypothetical protein
VLTAALATLATLTTLAILPLPTRLAAGAVIGDLVQVVGRGSGNRAGIVVAVAGLVAYDADVIYGCTTSLRQSVLHWHRRARAHTQAVIHLAQGVVQHEAEATVAAASASLCLRRIHDTAAATACLHRRTATTIASTALLLLATTAAELAHHGRVDRRRHTPIVPAAEGDRSMCLQRCARCSRDRGGLIRRKVAVATTTLLTVGLTRVALAALATLAAAEAVPLVVFGHSLIRPLTFWPPRWLHYGLHVSASAQQPPTY